jgi:hypothetical protein
MNCDLSVEELKAIAADGFLGDLLHAFEHTVGTIYNTVRYPIASIERSIVDYVRHPSLTPGLGSRL